MLVGFQNVLHNFIDPTEEVPKIFSVHPCTYLFVCKHDSSRNNIFNWISENMNFSPTWKIKFVNGKIRDVQEVAPI